MSWFARSLVDALRGEDDDEDDDSRGASAAAVSTSPSEAAAGSGWEEERDATGEEPGTPSRGVKEDLSQLTKTFTSRLWGVASFLAPPPASTEEEEEEDSSSPDPSGHGSQPEGLVVADTESNDPAEAATSDESPRLAGIRSDFAEISGKVRSGISMLSQAKAVAEISKFASSLLPFGFEEEGDEEEVDVDVKRIELDAVGVTEDVVVFARSIAMHPDTWLGFPLLNEVGDSDEFEMSDAQQKHAIAIDRFAPELADLRIELCPHHMSESNFWKIYFVLLHSRLSKQDAEILSTSQILEARTMLLHDLRIPKGPESESSEREGIHMKEDETAVSNVGNLAPSDLLHKSTQSITSSLPTPDPVPEADVETEKHTVETSALEVVDKSVIEEEPVKYVETKDLSHEAYRVPIQQDEEDGDDWLDDDTGEDDNSRSTVIPLGQEEDVSFSDLEDEDADADIGASGSKMQAHHTNTQIEDSRDWVQLNKDARGSTEGSNSISPQSKEASDWLNLEDIDVE